jgi:hypothetical protein
LEILNENGYPNMNMKEALATIRFCINIFYSEVSDVLEELQTSEKSEETRLSQRIRGNFYVNDIKVRHMLSLLLDVIIVCLVMSLLDFA